MESKTNTETLSNRTFQHENFVGAKTTWKFNENGNEVNIKAGWLGINTVNSTIKVESLGDGKFVGKSFISQKFSLEGNKTNSECSCCNKTYPISMLWCSHIKKRAKCSDEEKRDYNVVLPMCRFGCDELFEKGFIGVDDDGLIIQTKSISNKNIQNYINDLVGNKCDGFSNKNLKYFQWHRESHK